MEVRYSMNVRQLCLRLAGVNPMIDSEKTEEDGKICRDIFIESRKGNTEVLVRIDETKENEYNKNFKGFKTLSQQSQQELEDVVKEYCATPVKVRLTK